MVKQLNRQRLEEVQEDNDEAAGKRRFKSRRGAKLKGSAKPQGAIRVMSEKRAISNRPTNVYKEKVYDTEEGGNGVWVIWYTTEKSQTIGKEEIVQYNAKTEEEVTVGHDFTIPFTPQKAREILKTCFGATSYYVKDGETTYAIKAADIEKIFLGNWSPGLTLDGAKHRKGQ